MKRRAFLAAPLAATSLGAWARFVEPTWFDLTFTRIHIPGVRPTRVLHVADIHMSDGMTAEDLESGMAAGLAQRPDLICFTGDFVSNSTGFDREGLKRFLRRAADTAPAYAVLGNHDGGAWLARHGGSRSTEPIRELVEAAGVRVLHNEAEEIRGLRLAGVGDWWSGELCPERVAPALLAGKPTIMLCHNPDGKDELRHLAWDLMLSGHTHGGQARIPGIHPMWAPVLDHRFLAGLYGWERRQLFITRGLGSPKHVRAFCRPEVSILDLA